LVGAVAGPGVLSAVLAARDQQVDLGAQLPTSVMAETKQQTQDMHKATVEVSSMVLCKDDSVKKTRSYLPATKHALTVLGSQIAGARREFGWTAAEFAERLGVNAQLVGRIEKGVPGTAIGTVFEAAILCGLPLFNADPADLGDLADRQRERLAVLPARIRSKKVEVDDDF